MKELLGGGIVILCVWVFVKVFVIYVVANFFIRLFQFLLWAVGALALAYACLMIVGAICALLGRQMVKLNWKHIIGQMRRYWPVPLGCSLLLIAGIAFWHEPLQPKPPVDLAYLKLKKAGFLQQMKFGWTWAANEKRVETIARNQYLLHVGSRKFVAREGKWVEQ